MYSSSTCPVILIVGEGVIAAGELLYPSEKVAVTKTLSPLVTVVKLGLYANAKEGVVVLVVLVNNSSTWYASMALFHTPTSSILPSNAFFMLLWFRPPILNLNQPEDDRLDGWKSTLFSD